MGDGNNVTVILGRKRMGKTTLTRTLVLEQLRENKDTRFVVWDSTNEFSPLRRVEVLDVTKYSGEEAAQYALEVGDCTLVIPEADQCAPNNGSGLPPGSGLHTIVNMGRHFNVALIADTRRAARLSSDITNLADTVFVFRHRAPRDLDYIEEFVHEEGIRERVRRLPDHEFIRVDP